MHAKSFLYSFRTVALVYSPIMAFFNDTFGKRYYFKGHQTDDLFNIDPLSVCEISNPWNQGASNEQSKSKTWILEVLDHHFLWLTIFYMHYSWSFSMPYTFWNHFIQKVKCIFWNLVKSGTIWVILAEHSYG